MTEDALAAEREDGERLHFRDRNGCTKWNKHCHD